MAVDQGVLWATAFPQLAAEAALFEDLPFIERLRLGGRLLFQHQGGEAWLPASPDEPDTVRAWRAFAIEAATLPLIDGLREIRPFAIDHHFGVREWAWLAVRPQVCARPHEAITLLATAPTDLNASWRRFASEVTRPRSVWGRHIAELKQNPAAAERLLSALLHDTSRYVLTSAANWLNDVCRAHPAWVNNVCDRELRSVSHGSWFRRRATRGLLRAGLQP
jgi:3-methyladenine DNA glycosylase AlkC